MHLHRFRKQPGDPYKFHASEDDVHEARVMTDENICGALPLWDSARYARCQSSPKYPDGRCGRHSDYSENVVGPTAALTKAVCQRLRTGEEIKEAVKSIEGHSRASHRRWVEAAERLAEQGDFGNDYVEYYTSIQRAQSEDNRAPHRWVREAANRVEFAIETLEDCDPENAAVLNEYMQGLRRKADELETEGKEIAEGGGEA